jgi:hypothetical protein
MVDALTPAPAVGVEPFAQAAAKFGQPTELADAPQTATWPNEAPASITTGASEMPSEVRQATAEESSVDATIFR